KKRTIGVVSVVPPEEPLRSGTWVRFLERPSRMSVIGWTRPTFSVSVCTGCRMADRWFYTHAGQTHGPTPATALRELAARGELHPADLIWTEGQDPSRAIPAQAVVQFPEQNPPAVEEEELAELVFDFEPGEEITTQPPAPAPAL